MALNHNILDSGRRRKRHHEMQEDIENSDSSITPFKIDNFLLTKHFHPSTNHIFLPDQT